MKKKCNKIFNKLYILEVICKYNGLIENVWYVKFVFFEYVFNVC